MRGTSAVSPLIELRSATVRYRNGTVGLVGATLAVDGGDLVTVSGSSGAGKSSCLLALSGRAELAGGAVLFDGVDLTTMKRRALSACRRAVTPVPQDLRMLERRSVGENIAYGAELAQPAVAVAAQVAEILAALGLEEIGGRRPSEISGGERQRAALAMALAKRPALLLVDEPTANLDPTTAKMVAAVLDVHCRQGMACVVSTHDEAVFADVATRRVLIDAGRLHMSP